MPDHSTVNTIARRSGSNFYFSFFSLPQPQRQAITAVYAFCREVDDAVDDPAATDPQSTLTQWRDEIARTYEGRPGTDLTRSLAEAIERFDLSQTYFEGILDGVAMDLRVTRYATFKDLSDYCYHVAGEVGLLCMEIFGYRSERLKSYATHLGMAFQLTNILRDVRTDASRGRIYLPQEDLRRFGVTEELLLPSREKVGMRDGVKQDYPSPSSSPLKGEELKAFQRLMAFEATRARGFYQQAALLPTASERPALRAAEIMRAIYTDLLNRIEDRNYNVLEDRIRVPAPVKVMLALKTWWQCRG